MKYNHLLTLAVSVMALGSTHASITLFAEYHLGEPGSLGASNDPLDSVGTRHIDQVISPEAVSIGTPGGAPGSTAYLDTSDPTNSGYYHLSNFSGLQNDNFAIGVYAKAASLDAANHGTIFTTGNNGLEVGLRSNGWAGSIFNVAWVGEANGVTGSFTPDVWTHLALVRLDGVSTFYINGVAEPGTFGGAPTNDLPHVSVAPGGAANGYFDGGIDEIRVVTFDSGEPVSEVLTALTSVPEPSSLALLSIAGAAFLRRKR